MNRYECRYSMYLHHRGLKSAVWGVDIIDAIKKHNQNAILVWIEDVEDGQTYICKEHDTAGPDGYYDYYWVNEDTGELLYDERGEEKILPTINSSDITKTTTHSGWVDPDGKFYECEFEGHSELANLMLEIGMVKEGQDDEVKSWLRHDMESVFEARRWVKLSSKEIHYRSRFDSNIPAINKKQKDILIDYYLSQNKSTVKIFDREYKIEEFLDTKF